MTAIKITTEHKTILDFSNLKMSRHLVASKLRSTEFLEFKYNERKECRTYISYDIKIGIYTIYVDLCPTTSCGKKLKDYGGFCVRIYEGNKEVALKRDSRFKNQNWVMLSEQFRMRICDLIDAIMYCGRLNNLKAFL